MIQETLPVPRLASLDLNEFELLEPYKTRAFLEQHSFMEPLLAELCASTTLLFFLVACCAYG